MAYGYGELKRTFGHWDQTVAASSPASQQNPDPKAQTVEQATAGMTPEQKDAWVQAQVAQTVQDMQAKGIPVDAKKIGPVYYHDGIGGTHWDRETNGIDVYSTSSDNLTVAEFRSQLAHEVQHTQQGAAAYDKDPVRAEKEADQVQVKTYGAEVANRVIDKTSFDPRSYIDERKTNPAEHPQAPNDIRKKDNLDYETSLKKQGQKVKPSSEKSPPAKPRVKSPTTP